MKRFVTIATLVLSALVATVAQAKPAPRTLVEMVRAGHYDSVNVAFTGQDFSVKPERFTTARLEVITLTGPMGSGEMLGVLFDHGLRPATIEELLAYGAAHPNAQRKTNIVALGSSLTSADSFAEFPVLGGNRKERSLILQLMLPNARWANVSFLAAPDPNIRIPRTLGEMIEKGQYASVDPDITAARFPVKAKRFTMRGVQAIDFPETMSTKAILANLAQRGLRPATIEELLAYGANYPSAQRDHDIVALGTSWRNPKGEQLFPALAWENNTRVLGLYWGSPGTGWDIGCRILAFPK